MLVREISIIILICRKLGQSGPYNKKLSCLCLIDILIESAATHTGAGIKFWKWTINRWIGYAKIIRKKNSLFF